jgi:hypothetical protein
MKERKSKDLSLPNEEQIQGLLALSRDERFQTSTSSLMDAPEEWDKAMTDPSAWLRNRGLELPEDLTVEIIRQLSTSKPLDLTNIGMPGPDWMPFSIEQFHCRTYYLAKKDEEGKIKGYEEVTICFEFRVVSNPIPGGPLG